MRGAILTAAMTALAATAAAMPMREWDWHMPASIYKDLEFSDRASVDRATKLFQQAVDREWAREKVTTLVHRYRAAVAEWRKVQVQGETAGAGNESLLAYAVFMQGYARQQAHDRNEAVKLYNEVLDIYPEEKFIAIPARYMLSRVKREIGDSRQADEALEAIAADNAADGHVIWFSVVRDLAEIRWRQCKDDEAVELWEKLLNAPKRPADEIWRRARSMVILNAVVAMDFAKYEEVEFRGVPPEKKAERAKAIEDTGAWIAAAGNGQWNGITECFARQLPGDQKAKERQEKARRVQRAYAQWFETQTASVYAGLDDGWRLALARLAVYSGIDSAAETDKRLNAVTALVRNAKPDQVDGRADWLTKKYLQLRRGDDARNAAALTKNQHTRLWLQYWLECQLGAWKNALMYLEEFIAAKPSAGALKNAKYELADLYRRRFKTPEKAVKLYQEIDEPPRTLWALAETYRECGKKKESYQMLTEITSVFPNDAPNAVLRTADWRLADGEKEKAIAAYRSLMKHPKWKQSGASSQAHQALERLGIATGGAMTNEVH